jgi:ABC-type lipoprotein export system ATPase subunit
MLLVEGLTKSYDAPAGGRIPVLRGVELAVASGEFVVVVGASGSGKSTLLNLLGLLEDPDAGSVAYGGERVTGRGRAAAARARGRFVGFVFQSFMLLPGLTALDNVLLAARYVGRGGPETRRRALGLLEDLGVGHRRDHYPPQLAGGEQQRVAVCRAMLNEPPLLLADEPTGNLDDVNGRVILDALRARARAGGAVVVVSHRPETLVGASAVYRIDGGTLR